MAHIFLVNNGSSQDEGIAMATEAAETALRLDPGLPEAYVALGWIQSWFLGNQRKGIEYFKKALAIDPTNILANANLPNLYLYYCGKVTAARPYTDRLIARDPVDSLVRSYEWQGEMLANTGDFCGALVPYREFLQIRQRFLDPPSVFIYSGLLARCDSVIEAVAVAEKCFKANPNSTIAKLGLMLKPALAKDKIGIVEAITPELERTCKRDSFWSYHLGALLTKAGAAEEAWEWLENAVDRGFVNYLFWQKDPFLDGLRDDERFKKLIERVKYEWEHFEI